MQMWQLDVSYAHEDKASDDPGDDIAATIELNRRYLEGVVTIYPNLVKRWINKKYDENRIREVIAHEVSHIATQHFFDVATARYCDDGEMKDAWEACTTIIGRLVHKLGKKAWYTFNNGPNLWA